MKGVTSDRVGEALSSQDTYILFRQRRKPKSTRVLASNPGYQWQMDLCDMQASCTFRGARYILTAVDCFTWMAYAMAVRLKGSMDMVKGIRELFQKARTPPCKVQSDQSKEFTNRQVQEEFKRHNAKHFSTYNQETKYGLVESSTRP